MSILSAITDFGITLVTFSSRMKRVENKQDEIVKNYLQQFREVRQDIANAKLETTEKIGNMHIDLADKINALK